MGCPKKKTGKNLHTADCDSQGLLTLFKGSEILYRDLFSNASDAIFIHDLKGNIIEANETAATLTGYTPNDLAKMSMSELLTAKSLKLAVKRQQIMVKEKTAIQRCELELVRKNRASRNVKSVASLITFNDQPIGIQAIVRDITERKWAEEELQESEERLRQFFDNEPNYCYMISPDAIVLNVNKAALKVLGYKKEELVGKPLQTIYAPESLPKMKQCFEKWKRTGALKDEEFTIITKDGNRRTVLLSADVIRNGQGKVLHSVSVQRDITERKQMEEELRESEQWYRAIFEHAADSVLLIDAETGALVDFNDKAYENLGYSREEYAKLNIGDFDATESAEQVMRHLKKVVKEGSDVFETQHRTKGGEIRDVQINTRAVCIGGRDFTLGMCRDITERKRVEEALRESNEFSSSLLINSPNPIGVVNPDMSIRYVNPALEKVTGFPSAELIGKKPPYPWWPEGALQRTNKNFKKALQAGAGRFEELFQKKNGEQFWVEIIPTPVRKGNELKYYVSSWVDITEQKRLRENMKLYVLEVTKAHEEERKRIAREIHDESLQSLATLVHRIDAIVKEKEGLPEDLIQCLNGLRADTNSILQRLRRFSQELRPEVLDTVGLVPALELLIEEMNKDTKINASLKITGSERRLNPELELGLFRITQGALGNIRRHSGATKAAIGVLFTHKKVKLTVSDNGRGFKIPEVLSDLAIEGKLGLVSMQERAKLLGGELLVKSQVGKGTTVVVDMNM